MIIKRFPEDFKVEEVTKVKEDSNGNYSVYLLTKNGIDTLGAVNIIKKKFRLNDKQIGVAGLKDKHAFTTQYISIEGRQGNKFDFQERSLSLKFVHYTKEPILVGLLSGNKFEITVRQIRDSYVQKLQERSKLIGYGVPNYYGEQRFGSYSGKKGFIGKYLIMGDNEKALRIYFTHYIKSENQRIKDMKRFIDENWGEWKKCIEYILSKKIKSSVKIRILRQLAKTKDFNESVLLIPNKETRLYVEAYQSYIWNEITRRVIEFYGNKTFTLSYNAGIYSFYDRIKDSSVDLLYETKFNLKDIEAPEQVYEIINRLKKDILKKEGISENLINKKISSSGSLKLRNIIIFPKRFSLSNITKDEAYNGYLKVKLRFELPPGCYATMVTRVLFKQ